MKTARHALLIPALALALSLAACSPGANAQTEGTATPLEAKALIAAEPDLKILDVRTPQEFAQGHIAGAVNIDVTASDFLDRVKALPRDGEYLVYCRSGTRSARAQEMMEGDGFANVTNMTGGIIGWEADNLPVTAD